MARRDKPELTILYADDALVVVDKPAGVLSAPGRGKEPAVADLLRENPDFGPRAPFRIVHRLDRDASGVLLLARTLTAQRSLVAQFAQREVQKMYLALVNGFVTDDGSVDLNIALDRRRQRMKASRGRGQTALTHYAIRERVVGNTLLECRPVTGRTHQIRVHMAAIGHPLSVDPVYGGAERLMLSDYKRDYRPSRRHPERPLIARLTLHATELKFTHPDTGVPMTLAAPEPKDLRATLSQLRRLM